MTPTSAMTAADDLGLVLLGRRPVAGAGGGGLALLGEHLLGGGLEVGRLAAEDGVAVHVQLQ